MSSPLMTDALKQVYYVLWPYPAGLTKGEAAAACKAQSWTPDTRNPWDKAVAHLEKMGLAKKGDKRHCTAKNKPEPVYFLTDLTTPIRLLAPKPTGKTYTRGVAQFEMVIAHHDSHGDNFITPELRKLYEWVRDKVPDKKKA